MKAKINIKNFEKFEEYARNYCAKHDKIITVVSKKTVYQDGFEQFKCAGFCDGYEMVVAKKSQRFHTVFVHEFSHLTQMVDCPSRWIDSGDIWSDMENGKVSLKQWREFVKTIEVERDCERRSLNLIKKFDITCPKNYARNANIYLYYYQYVFMTGNWAQKKSPYECADLYKLMPEKLLPASHFNNINMEVMMCFSNFFKEKRKKRN
jgi:hypothetical protein